MEWNNLVRNASKSAFRKRNIWFFILFYVFSSLSLLNAMTNIVVMEKASALIGLEVAMNYLKYLIPIIFFLIIPLSLAVYGAFICSIHGKENSILSCMKHAARKLKSILGAVIIITLLQLLLVLFLANTNFFETENSEANFLFENQQNEKFDTLQNAIDYGSAYAIVLMNYAKPQIITPLLVKEACILDKATCMWALSTHYTPLALVQVFLYMLVSILLLFVVQGIVLNDFGAIKSIKNSINIAKRNMNDVILLYMISLVVFLFFALTGSLITYVLHAFFGLTSVAAYNIFISLGLMFVFALQTKAYIVFYEEEIIMRV